MTVQRADARRNYTRILAVAEEEVAAHGADASMEQIARTAGVGSATVRRHFPSKQALLEAVFAERTEALCTRASALTDAPDARAALLDWLGALTDYATSARGVADLLAGGAISDQDHVDACAAKLSGSADPLLQRAKQAGAVGPGITLGDLITLVTGLALATEHHQNPNAEARRLLTLTLEGISPRG